MSEVQEEGVPDSGHARIPFWLICISLLLVVLGIFWYVLDFHGTCSYLDPGSWRALQRVANTTDG